MQIDPTMWHLYMLQQVGDEQLMHRSLQLSSINTEETDSEAKTSMDIGGSSRYRYRPRLIGHFQAVGLICGVNLDRARHYEAWCILCLTSSRSSSTLFGLIQLLGRMMPIGCALLINPMEIIGLISTILVSTRKTSPDLAAAQ
jgi:hypothetical protein